MKRAVLMGTILVLGLISAPPAEVAAAEITEREVTKKTTTTYSGTVNELDPSSSTIILKSASSAAPVKYRYTEKTTFVDEAGNEVKFEAVRNQPVTVHYVKEGDAMVVSRVIVSRPTGGVIQRREKTIEEEEVVE
jgi:hypothetical protein